MPGFHLLLSRVTYPLSAVRCQAEMIAVSGISESLLGVSSKSSGVSASRYQVCQSLSGVSSKSSGVSARRCQVCQSAYVMCVSLCQVCQSGFARCVSRCQSLSDVSASLCQVCQPGMCHLSDRLTDRHPGQTAAVNSVPEIAPPIYRDSWPPRVPTLSAEVTGVGGGSRGGGGDHRGVVAGGGRRGTPGGDRGVGGLCR